MLSSTRVRTRSGVTIPAHQHAVEYAPLKTEVISVPSAVVPSWGTAFNVDFKEKNITCHELCLQFNLSAITSMTSGMYVPSPFFVDHIDYYMGGIIDTYYPADQFLQTQLFERDEDRALINTATGHYASTAQRIAMASAANSYYLPMRDFFKQAKVIRLLENCHDLQLRIFLQPLASVTSGTGTAVATITSVNLLAKVTRHRDNELDVMKKALSLGPSNYRFNDLKTQSFTVNSGVSAATLILSGITGPVSYLFFTVRPSASLTGNNAFAYTAIASYEMANASGTNMVGGQTISNSEALLILGNINSKSSYLSETALGVTDNKANVYIYSFSGDPSDSSDNAVSLGVHNFAGNEQLKINFTSSLGAAAQVDVYAYTEAIVSFSKQSVKKGVYHH
jgi:hypothetical protein